ncbi:TPA: hypothetical protein ACN30A_003312 [Vibrio parahaemolyticus]
MKEKIEKKTILLNQINKACSLYLKKEYICALTLGGSAESMSEGLLSAEGSESYSDLFVKFKRTLTEWLGNESPKKNVIIKGKNWSRNVIKHHDKGDDATIEIDLKFESFIVLKSCLENYQKLGFGLTPVMRQFNKETRDLG